MMESQYVSSEEAEFLEDVSDVEIVSNIDFSELSNNGYRVESKERIGQLRKYYILAKYEKRLFKHREPKQIKIVKGEEKEVPARTIEIVKEVRLSPYKVIIHNHHKFVIKDNFQEISDAFQFIAHFSFKTAKTPEQKEAEKQRILKIKRKRELNEKAKQEIVKLTLEKQITASKAGELFNKSAATIVKWMEESGYQYSKGIVRARTVYYWCEINPDLVELDEELCICNHVKEHHKFKEGSCSADHIKKSGGTEPCHCWMFKSKIRK